MAKIIRVQKDELCWITHNYDWTEQDYINYKKWLEGHSKECESDIYTDMYRVLYGMIKDLSWDEVVDDYEKWQNGADSLSAEYEARYFDGTKETRVLILAEQLDEMMAEDCWDADYEIGDCIETDGRIDIVDDSSMA